MSYSDSITIAAQHAFQNGGDMPMTLLGNTIVSEACMLSRFDSDLVGCSNWD